MDHRHRRRRRQTREIVYDAVLPFDAMLVVCTPIRDKVAKYIAQHTSRGPKFNLNVPLAEANASVILKAICIHYKFEPQWATTMKIYWGNESWSLDDLRNMRVIDLLMTLKVNKIMFDIELPTHRFRMAKKDDSHVAEPPSYPTDTFIPLSTSADVRSRSETMASDNNSVSSDDTCSTCSTSDLSEANFLLPASPLVHSDALNLFEIPTTCDVQQDVFQLLTPWPLIEDSPIVPNLDDPFPLWPLSVTWPL